LLFFVRRKIINVTIFVRPSFKEVVREFAFNSKVMVIIEELSVIGE